MKNHNNIKVSNPVTISNNLRTLKQAISKLPNTNVWPCRVVMKDGSPVPGLGIVVTITYASGRIINLHLIAIEIEAGVVVIDYIPREVDYSPVIKYQLFPDSTKDYVENFLAEYFRKTKIISSSFNWNGNLILHYRFKMEKKSVDEVCDLFFNGLGIMADVLNSLLYAIEGNLDPIIDFLSEVDEEKNYLPSFKIIDNETLNNIWNQPVQKKCIK